MSTYPPIEIGVLEQILVEVKDGRGRVVVIEDGEDDRGGYLILEYRPVP